MRRPSSRHLSRGRDIPADWHHLPATPADLIVSSKELHFDFDRRLIRVRGQMVHLTPKEFELLKYLVANRDKPVSHVQVLQTVWGPAMGDQRERLRVVVNELRKKIEVDPARPKYILTEFCVGYRFVFPDGARIQPTVPSDP